MKLALYQGPPTGGDLEAAFARLKTQLAAAAAAGARMLVAPELFLPGYNQPELHPKLAQPKGGDWHQRLQEMARVSGCGVTVGWAERDGDAVYNSASAIDASGDCLAHYRKLQLFGPMERASFVAGQSYCHFDLYGIKSAILICYDVEFASHVQILAQDGVKLILVPTANPAGFEHVSRLLVPARAAEMDVTIAYANYCGTEGDLIFGGHSLIAGPNGATIAAAGQAETLLIADLATSPTLPPEKRSTQLSDLRKV